MVFFITFFFTQRTVKNIIPNIIRIGIHLLISYLGYSTFIDDKLEPVKSSIDNKEYLVQDKEDAKEAADLIAVIRQRLVNLVEHLIKSYPPDVREPDNADEKSPAFDEVKEAVEPLVEEALVWLEENDKDTTESYKNKQKELEEKINPYMMKLYGNKGGQDGMPDGMPTNQEFKPDIEEVD